MAAVTESSPKSAAQVVADATRFVFGRQRWLLVLGASILGLALMFKWSWLVAVGIAPIVLSLLPCVAMCALGLCMRKMSANSSGAQPDATDKSPDVATGATAPLLLAGSDGSSDAPTSGDKPTNVVALTEKSCCHNPR